MSSRSNMKSASFYLQKIVNFIRSKTIEYKSINAYLEVLKRNEGEVFKFLDNVIMNKHRYEGYKQTFRESAKAQEKFNKNLKIALIVCNVIIGIGVISTVLIKSRLIGGGDEGGDTLSFASRLKIVILTVIGLFVYTIASYLAIVHCDQMVGDYARAGTYVYNGERFFDKFEHAKGVAMFHAHKFVFTEPAGPTRKDIKGFYDSYVTANSKRAPSKMTLAEILAHPDWPKIVDGCRPEYATTPLASNIAAPKVADGVTQQELDALASEENTLRMWDDATMLQEIRTKSKALVQLVTTLKDGGVSDKLNDTSIAEIVKKEVVPLFVQRDILYALDISVKDPKTFDLTPIEEFSVESEQEGIIYMQRNTNCNFVVYDAGKKVCAAFEEKTLPKSSVLHYSKGSCMFFSNNVKDDRFVFLEGGELTQLPVEPIAEMAPKTSDCITECMDDPTCVSYKFTDGVCKKNISMARPSFDKVQRECKGASCTTYKFELAEIGQKIDKLGFFDVAKTTIQNKVFQISQKYNFEFKWIKFSDVIRTELNVAYANTEIDMVMVKVTEILEAAEMLSRNSKQSMMNKLISLDRFISKLDDMSIGDVLFYRQNVVQKLYDVIYILHGKVEDGLANPNAVERNMFVEKERALQRQKVIVYSITSALGLAYVYYLVDAMETRTGAVQMCMPLVLVGVLASIIVSYHVKETAMYEYNKNILEANDTKLLDSIFILLTTVDKVQKQAPNKSVKSKIGDLHIREETKQDIYDSTREVINLLERCNLTTDASNILLPFPYVDVSINITMILVSVAVILYMVQSMSPVENVFQIRLTNKIVQLVQDHPGKYKMVDFPEFSCLAPETMPLKIIGILVFIVISVAFSTKVLRSSSEYAQGLYNSRYFAEARCVK